MKIKLLLGALILLLSAQVSAALITFEDVVDPTDINDVAIFDSPDEHLETNDLIFKATDSSRRVYVQSAAFHAARSFSDNGSNTLGSYSLSNATGPLMRIFSENLFSLNSVDFAEYGGETDRSPLDSLQITGYYLDGSPISNTIEFDGITDGPGGATDFQSELFDASWTGLTYVEIGSDPPDGVSILFYMDNIEFENLSTINPLYEDLLAPIYPPPAVIPIPGAVWLFGTALIGLVGFSRRRKAA